MTEQERAEQLDQALDRLFDGEDTDQGEPLYDIARMLAGGLVQPSARSVDRLEQQITQWFGPEGITTPPARPVRRVWSVTPAVIAAGFLIVIASIAVLVSRNAPGAGPSATTVAALLTPMATRVVVIPTYSPAPSVIASPTSTLDSLATRNNGTPSATVIASTSCTANVNGAAANADDSSDLPILLGLSGPVQAINLPTLQINDLTVRIPTSLPVPAAVQAGSTVTIRGSLCNDDTILASTIISQIAPNPPVSTAPASDGTTIPVSDCYAPNQPLAMLLSTNYTVPYADIAAWHCKGYTYGVIARAYRLAIIAAGQNKPIAVADILTQRTAGARWSVLIARLGIQLLPESGLASTKPPGAVTDIATNDQDRATPTPLSPAVPATVISVTGIPYVTVVVEGPIESVNGEAIVVYGQRVKLAKNDPDLARLKIGNWVKISGSYGTDDDQVTVVIIAINVTIIDAPTTIIVPPPSGNENSGDDNDGGHPKHKDD